MMWRVSQKNKKQVTKGPTPPPSILYAAILASLQSLVAIVFGAFLMVRDFTGAENDSMVTSTSTASHVGTGTAIFIFIIFVFVIASSWAMTSGMRLGRGSIEIMELFLGDSTIPQL